MKQILIFLALLFLSCSKTVKKNAQNENARTYVQNWVIMTNALSKKNNLLKQKPINFLHLLAFKDLDTGTIKIKKIHNLPMNYFIQNEWVNKKDVAELIKYIHKKNIVQMPWPIISSQLPRDNSTMGIEAMHLIEIYKDSTFRYPSLCSTHYFCKPMEQDSMATQLEVWWSQMQKK